MLDENWLDNEWKRILTILGAPYVKIDKKNEAKPALHLHDFRRTRVTLALRSKTDHKTIMAQTGHKTMAVFQGYNQAGEDDQREYARMQDEFDRAQQARRDEFKRVLQSQSNETVLNLIREEKVWTADKDNTLDLIREMLNKVEWASDEERNHFVSTLYKD